MFRDNRFLLLIAGEESQKILLADRCVESYTVPGTKLEEVAGEPAIPCLLKTTKDWARGPD